MKVKRKFTFVAVAPAERFPRRRARRTLAAAALTLLIPLAGASPALADASCRPGSLTPGCAAGTAPQNPGGVHALTASFHGLPEAHEGSGLFAFELRFSREFAGLRLGMLRRTLEVTGGRLVDVKRAVRGQNRSMTVRVRPASSGEVTVALPGVGSLWGAASATVAGPSAPSGLTASFHGLPDEHDGRKLFSFEIRFSEEFAGLRLTALREALEVTGGRLIDVKRTVRGENRRVTVRVRPASHAPVTVALGATADCTVAGAICARDGRKLSGAASASVTSPAWWPGEPVIRPVSAKTLRDLSVNLPVVKTVQKTVSTAPPPGFPTGDAGLLTNINGFGNWDAPDIALRERYGRGGHYEIDFPCRNREANDNLCRIGGDHGVTGGLDAYGRWFSYPANAGANDMKVHLRVLRAEWGTHGKSDLVGFFNRGHSLDYFFDHLDFFKAEAHLEAPGTAVQPTGAGLATWSGKAVGLESSRNLLTRGDLIGGNVQVNVNLGTSNMDLHLTNLKAGHVWNRSFPDQTWNSLSVANGSFSHSDDSRSIQGTFRHQGTSGTSPNTVGGTFEVKRSMVGGFVASRN